MEADTVLEMYADPKNSLRKIVKEDIVQQMIELLDSPMHVLFTCKDGSCLEIVAKVHRDWKRLYLLTPHNIIIDKTVEWSNDIPKDIPSSS